MKDIISIIVPCYNEQEVLPLFYDAITNTFESIDAEYELLFVDDGSKDNTYRIIKEFASKDKKVKYISFARNFGKEAAMYAGLSNAKGDYVAIMDADLQDPPEQLHQMYEIVKSKEYDCVATRRVTRKGEPKIRSAFARIFYKLINNWSGVEVVDGARDYRLMSRQMVDAILKLKEYNRFSKGLFSFVGFKTKWLEYENIKRAAGKTKWNFFKLFGYAIEGIVGFTVKPLFLVLECGVAMFVLDILVAITLGIIQLAGGDVINLVSILLVVGVLLTSIVIMCMGIVATYIAKSYLEIKNRPIYIEKDSNV